MIEDKTTETLKNITYGMIVKTSKMFKVPLKDFQKRLPRVRIDQRAETPYYDSRANEIVYRFDDAFNIGPLAAEEASHFHRCLYVPDSDTMPQEIIGALGSILVTGADMEISDEEMRWMNLGAEAQKSILELNKMQLEMQKALVPISHANSYSAQSLEYARLTDSINKLIMGIRDVDRERKDTEVHQVAYGVAQRICDAGVGSDFIEEYDIIRASDVEVVRAARDYVSSLRAGVKPTSYFRRMFSRTKL